MEHWNEESGETWARRLLDHFPKAAWLNPEPESHWEYAPSVAMTRTIFDDRMFPLTIRGLEDAMRRLTRAR